MAELIIKNRSLPDLDDADSLSDHNLRDYGRFAILDDGSMWLGDVYSSNPDEASSTFFWAITKSEELLICAQHSKVDDERIFGSDKRPLAWVVEELVSKQIIGKPTGTRIAE
ncbi:MAG: hypothetical protein JW904_00645 [Spirochaetales bacterium]|nr:hypothetical protein [Spirochaetales bacterium]